MLKSLIPKRIRAEIGLHFPYSWVLEGRPKGCSGKLRVLFGGDDPFGKAYTSKRLFDGDVREYYQGRTMRLMTAATARQVHCELSIAATGGSAGHPIPDSYEYLIPQWVTAEVELTEEDVEEGRSKSRRRDLRQLAKNGLRYELTTDEQVLIEFYDNMYLPTMKASHGEGSILMKRDAMLQRVREGKCELLVVMHEQQRIAGSLIAYDGEIPRLWSSGIRSADRRYLRLGAGNAVYLFSFQYLLMGGCNRVNVGLSRAFLSDGALYFKRRFGILLTGASETGFALRIFRPSAAVQSCLSANPFIFRDGSSLLAAVFVSADCLRDEATWRAIWDAHYIPGIKQIVVHAFHDRRSKQEVLVPRHLRGQIDLRCMDVDPIRDRGS